MSKSSSIPQIVILIGDLKQDIPNWSSKFDAKQLSDSQIYSEGQYQALYLRIRRYFSANKFQYGQVYDLGNEKFLILKYHFMNEVLLYCVITKEISFSEELINQITIVAKRGGRYTARKFFEEVVDLHFNPEAELDSTISEVEALVQLDKADFETTTTAELAGLLQIVSKDSFKSADMNVFNATLHVLNNITDEDNSDVALDAAYHIAVRFFIDNIYYYALKLFEAIANSALKFNRLPLEITCRLSIARILKMQDVENSSEIIKTLEPIDDGSLEVASSHEREEYYSLMGYSYKLNGDLQTAEDFYYMTIMISEGAINPSTSVGEAHTFMAEIAANSFKPNVASREYLTAATIYAANNELDIKKKLEYLAALQRLKWSQMLGSAALIHNMEGDFDKAEFQSWQSLNKLIDAMHPILRRNKSSKKTDVKDILNMNYQVLKNSSNENASQTLDELIEHVDNISGSDLPEEQERELVNFLSSKVSAMIPLPQLHILLIAYDGRLITAGEIGTTNWGAEIDNDLMSGVLTAIMAIFSEITSEDNPLRMVDAGTTRILIEPSNYCVGALLVDRELHVLRKALREVVFFMDNNFPELSDWDGYSIDFDAQVRPKVDEVFTQALQNLIKPDEM
jgi:hypothetical protein